MFDAKNLSPKKLAAFTALTLSLPISLGIYFLQGKWQAGVIALALIFAGSYALILYIIQKFIYRIFQTFRFIQPGQVLQIAGENPDRIRGTSAGKGYPHGNAGAHGYAW